MRSQGDFTGCCYSALVRERRDEAKEEEEEEEEFLCRMGGREDGQRIYNIHLVIAVFLCACVSTKEGVRGIETRSNDDETRTTSGASC